MKLNKQDLMVYGKINIVFRNIIKPEMSDFDKELAVHDYLILTSRYDYEKYKNSTITENSYTPYGLLFKNKAVCNVYAEVFMIFMTLAKIECYYVIGNVTDINGMVTSLHEDMGHAWNIIKYKTSTIIFLIEYRRNKRIERFVKWIRIRLIGDD